MLYKDYIKGLGYGYVKDTKSKFWRTDIQVKISSDNSYPE